MYPAPFRYYRPNSVQEAIKLMSQTGDEATLLAGGQSLIPMMKLRMGEFRHVVDIGKLTDLSRVEQHGDMLHIGALARHAQIASSGAATMFPMLQDIAGGIADKQVRTMGTIGGGLSMADPSGCWPCGLRTLDAIVLCQGLEGGRAIPIDKFILGSYSTALAKNELVTEIRIPLPSGQSAGAYVAFKRAAAAYPTVSVSFFITLENGICTRARIALGGAGSTTIVSRKAEQRLESIQIDEAALEQAASIIVSESSPPQDARGSTEFKRAMLHSLVIEAGNRALARAQGQNVRGGHRYA